MREDERENLLPIGPYLKNLFWKVKGGKSLGLYVCFDIAKVKYLTFGGGAKQCLVRACSG